MAKIRNIGILTSGGDAPGLNAAIRGVGKALHEQFDGRLLGFRNGFRGLMQDRVMELPPESLSNILTHGGTILGTSRDKPHKMPMGDEKLDMTDVIVHNYQQHSLDALVCLGGGGTIKNAYRLVQKGLNIITLPKTIDNDVSGTEATFGFDTALTIATEAIDRLHSTAHSHHRIIVVEIMGHNTGWLALAAGLAGGADVILIPEIPYDVDKVAEAISLRSRGGKGFSIVAVAEGAMTKQDHHALEKLYAQKEEAKANKDKEGKKGIKAEIAAIEGRQSESTLHLSHALEERTSLESRLTILGHVQRGGTPSPVDRLLATRLGTAAARYIAEGQYGIMVGVQRDATVAVPLEEIVGKRKTVPLDHPLLESARLIGTNLGD